MARRDFPAKQKLRRSLSGLGTFLPIRKSQVSYIVEPKSWSIKADGVNIVREAKSLTPDLSIGLTNKPYLTRAEITHFGSQFMFQNWLEDTNRDSNIVVTYFHGEKGQNPSIDSNLDYLIQNQQKVAKVIVSFTGMKERLERYGLEPNLIVKIPVGVSTDLFLPSSSKIQTRSIRDSLGIPDEFHVIGSFQKDGEGWRDGMLPKSIKGPDIFVDAIREISKSVPTFVVLSGPARGYVRNKLEEFGIPYKHVLPRNEQKMVDLYRALDLYLISSREEGGPKGLIEALSTGCPVVTTPVGMANDLNLHSDFYSVSKTFDPLTLAEYALNILKLERNVKDVNQLRTSVLHCNWRNVAEHHLLQVYIPLLNLPQDCVPKG